MSFFLFLVVGSGAVGQMGFETCLIFSPRGCFFRPRRLAVCAGVRGVLAGLMFEHNATVHGLLVSEAMQQIGDDLAHLG